LVLVTRDGTVWRQVGTGYAEPDVENALREEEGLRMNFIKLASQIQLSDRQAAW